VKFLLIKAGLAIFLLFVHAVVSAQISGRVLDQDGQPIAGAIVRVQALENSPEVTTGANGVFNLNFTPTSNVGISAAKAYDHTPGVKNYASQVFGNINQPATGVDITLQLLTPSVLAGYQPETSGTCGGCHGRYRTDWLTSNHSNSARNVWVKDLFSGNGTPGGAAGYVYKDSHGMGESGFCATCHAPLQDVFTPGLLQFDAISTPAGQDGVTCMGCHQLANVNANQINGLHHVNKSSYHFSPDLVLQVFGALADVETGTMFNVYNPLFKQPLLCASCHQYNNQTTGAPGQSTFTEWTVSPYAVPGPGFKTCQDCHMPQETSPGTIASTSGLSRPASQRHRHTFIGATQTTLPQAIQVSVTSVVQGAELAVSASVINQGAGHAFPTGVSIRNAVLLVRARTKAGVNLALASGPTVPSWANDDVAGVQPGDWAGLPGRGYAKVLEGRINGQGAVVRPVLFIDAETVAESNVIAAGATDSSSYRFTLPAGVNAADVDVEAQLYYRRAFRALAVTKGWTTTPRGGPVEYPVNRACVSGAGGACDRLIADGFE
jgi:nitrate/TMAO reductase-like tetraheme cytochrome c subunit